MTKIIFFDIDGTLVSFQTHRIPQSALTAISAIRRRGIKVWIATGRPMHFINNLAGLDYDGIISVNGAHCQTRQGQVIFTNPVDATDIERMTQLQLQTGLAVTYAGNDRAMLVAPGGIPPAVDEVFSLLDIPRPVLHQPHEALTFPVMEVIGFYREDQSADIMQHVLCHCNELRWHPAFADSVAMGSTKATAIDHVIAHYGFDLSETMAFGDGGNDIPMLRHVALGVAMGNASDEVKAAADIVTTSVDDDGIANILNRI